MMTPIDYLTKLGLSKKQVKIYLDLATYPESTVVHIHKRIQLPRSSIYLELERLIDNGYVISKKVGKSTFYRISNPKILRLILEEKNEKLQFLTQNLDTFSERIKQLLWNIIISKADLVIGFSPGQLEHVTDRDFAEKWREEFRNLNMHNKIIFNKPAPLTWSDIPNFLEENVEAKTLDEKKIKFDRMILIYKDILTVCSLKTDSDQYGIEIRDDLLVKSYIQMFEFLWNHVAKTLKRL